VIVPVFLIGTVNNLAYLDAAKASGDDYPALSVLVIDGAVSAISACFGCAFPTSVFVGECVLGELCVVRILVAEYLPNVSVRMLTFMLCRAALPCTDTRPSPIPGPAPCTCTPPTQVTPRSRPWELGRGT
jgi:hypothetical protein